ncbi:MAG: hypothetical protein GXP62_14460 [Oligoflexia bacterium]|nr:hypothetical protein [Oligoflexia bacterium]
MAVLVAGLSGCGSDACQRLCDHTGSRLEACLATWPATWADLDATSKVDFQGSCQSEWSQVRSDLEPRQLDDALKQCEETLADLTALRQQGTACDYLRALYID